MILTEEQKSAIMCEKGDFLVSASAGSGKTFVMIQRLITLITEGKTSVDKILAVTFTNLAAAEMKEKLAAAISEKLTDPDLDEDKKKRLKAELDELPTAAVSTFHAFCADLIKNYFFELGLDASFRVADEVRSDLIKKRAIEKVFSEKYAKKDEGLKLLLSYFISRRSDVQLIKSVLELHEFFWAEAYPQKFAEKSLYYYTEEGYEEIEAAFISHYRHFFDILKKDIEALKEDFELAGEQKQVRVLKEYSEVCANYISSISMDEMAGVARTGISGLPPMRTKDEYILSLKERRSQLKESLKKESEYILKIFGVPKKKRVENLTSMRAVAENLVRLVFDFDGEYASMKHEDNVVDFSDLEHFALALLDNTEICAAVSERYEYIVADEYQDTNGVQEAILEKIARGNVFMVGDVKQSIYAFRGCNPTIFLDKQKKYQNGEGKNLSLSTNFRCSKAVVKAVNDIFSEVMTKETSDIDYSAEKMKGSKEEEGYAALHLVLPQEKNAEKPAKKGVYSVRDNIGGNDDGEIFTEGLLIASLIKKITSEAKEGGDGSPYGYGDIVVLTRYKTAYARKLTEALLNCDIPVTSEVKKDVTVYPEIRHLVSLLRVIDCAEQDIPLCAVMRGPTGKFTDAELAEIRLFANEELKKDNGAKRGSGFCDAVKIYMERAKDCDLRKKLVDFFAYVEKLRFLADYEGAGGIIARAVREKGIDLSYLAGTDGKNRVRRINRLIDEAGDGGFSVRDFLERLDADTEDVAVTDVGGADAVRLMSIHSAKGLEFPVVILAGLQQKFNHMELSKLILRDRKYGFAMKTYRVDGMIKEENILDEYLRRRYRFSAAVEEMRVLYVALTRAKSRLYLTANNNEASDSLSSSGIAGATSYLKMIPFKKIEKFEYTAGELEGTGAVKEPRAFVVGKPNAALCENLKKNLSFTYRYDTSVRSKSTVTALLRSGEEDVFYTPVIVSEDEPDARTTGDAYHRFLELIDFEKCLKSQLIEQKSSFESSGELPGDWAKLIDVNKVAAVLEHDFFHIKNAEYFKEQPFEVFMPSEMIGEGEGEAVLVQGVIDVIAFTPQGIRIADYKVSGRLPDALREKYKKQLDLYAYAAEKITGQKVISKTLFNLKRGETVEL